MRVINDGKLSIFSFRIYKYLFEIDWYLTEDCSIRLRNFSILYIRLYNFGKLIYKREIQFLKLK